MALLAGCSAADNNAVVTATSLPSGLCFSGGPIYTADDSNPTAQGLAISRKTITYVGPDAGNWCAQHAGKGARNIDLSGAALFPGFTDGHGHLMEIGIKEMSLKLTDIKSIPELQARLKTAVDTTPKGETIFSRGWIETHWPEKRFPTKDDLDAVSPDHPVVLERADGHAVVVNSAMLALAGIDGDTPSPDGGDILKGVDGSPTGMLIDKAAFLVLPFHPELTEARKREAYIKGASLYASRGWTNIHAVSFDPADMTLAEGLVDGGDIGLRVYGSVLSPNGKVMPGSNAVQTDLDNHFTMRAIKLYVDGALGSRGAALFEDYSDDPGNLGIMRMQRDASIAIFKDALRTGTQVTAHAIGDKANRELLDWFEAAFDAVPVSERAVAEPRWRVEHAQILSLDDLARFKALGVIPSMQPSHAIGDLHFAVDRLGLSRLEGAYAWRSLIDAGAIIVGGTDAPVEVGDPMIEFYAAVTRKDLNGFSGPGWYPSEVVSRDDALKMFTLWPAVGAFQDHGLGSLTVGKRADISVFDKDIMTVDGPDILEAKAVMTVVDGEIIFNATQ